MEELLKNFLIYLTANYYRDEKGWMGIDRWYTDEEVISLFIKEYNLTDYEL